MESLNYHLINNKKVLDETLTGISIINLDGKIVASTDADEIGKDEGEDEYFIKGREEVFVTDMVGHHEHFGHQNYFVVAAPLFDKYGNKLLGVIVNTFDTTKIESLLSGQFQIEDKNISNKEEHAKILDSYLVNNKKEIIVYSATEEKNGLHIIVDTLPVRKCLEDNEEIVGQYTNYNGVEVIGASKCIPVKEWVLLVEVGKKEAFASIDNLYSFLLFAIIFFILLIIAAGFIFANRISRPIVEMREAVREMEKGNFNKRIKINRRDELGALGNAFNQSMEALGKLEEEKKQIDKAKTEFLSITSHELRSPMTPMKAQLEMMLEGYYGRLTARQRESLNIVLRNTNRLDKVIEDLLDISRMESARLKFNFIKTNLVKETNLLVKEMSLFMPEKNIKIISHIESLPIIEADPDRTMQVLRNLINNAKKFSNPNTKIIVEVMQKGAWILFSVKDNGIGIHHENINKLFEPFFQEEQTIYREHTGVGLGLAICRGIVESQNGKIWIESQLGKGSTFYFTLPLKPVKEVKPLKILFASKINIEERVRKLLIIYLGELGERKFEELKKEGMQKENIIRYIDTLFKEKVLDKERTEKLKTEIILAFESPLQKTPYLLGAEELYKAGLLKK